MSQELRVPKSGTCALQVVPLDKNSSGKYVLPTTIKKYIFNGLVKESGWEQDKPSESSTSDSYMSWEDPQGQTLQVKRNPVTKTYNLATNDFDEETSGGTKVYPAFVAIAANAPALKSGTTTQQLSVTAFRKLLIDWQNQVCLLNFDLGEYWGTSEATETGWMIGKVSTKIEAKDTNSDFKGTSFTFSGLAAELDATSLTAEALTSLPEAITVLGTAKTLTMKPMVAADLADLASGDLVFKLNS
jgi:hypothetical protein